MGLFLSPDVYNSPASLTLSETLTLDGVGNLDAVWIFQLGTTLTTASGSIVHRIGGAQASHVFRQVGSSATLETESDFAGTLMADQSITASIGAAVKGRLLASGATVSIDFNDIDLPAAAIPEPATAMLLGSGGIARLALRRQHNRR